jgi:hypothetical protein
MNKNLDFKLVNGTFNADDAKTVVNSLIESKINHHNLEDFSNSIRFNSDSSHSKKRIIELNEINTKLNEIIAEAGKNDKIVELNCHFEINIK